LDGSAETGQVGEPAGIATVDPACLRAAERTRRGRCGRLEKDGQAVYVEDEMIETTPGWGSKEFERKQENPPWMQFNLD